MGRTIMDEDAMAAMEADRVAKAEMHEYLQKVNGPNGGRGHSTAAIGRKEIFIRPARNFRHPSGGKKMPPLNNLGQAGEEIEGVNADELYKRLQRIPPDSDDRDVCAPRPFTPTASPTGPETPLAAITEEDMRNYRKASEYGDYHLLVSDGARPAYPIERLEAVEQDPDAYFELLYRWSHIESYDMDPDHWQVFQRQLMRWEHFRNWQLRQRHKIDELSLEKFIEKKRTRSKRMADHIPEYRKDPITPSRPIRKYVYEKWRLDQRLRRRDRAFIRQEDHKDHKPIDFAKIVEAIGRRLSEHGFTSHIDFDIDPKKQGQLATWAEYVDFELRWLSAYEAAVERAAPEVEKTWQKYHAQGQFSKEETVQVLQSRTFKDKLWRETDQRAEDQAAASEDLEWLRQQIESHSQGMADAKLENMLQAAEQRAHNADELYMRVVRKRAATTETLNTGRHRENKGLVAKQKALAQWAWDQLLLIEDENRLNAATGPVKGAGSSPGRQASLPPAASNSVRTGEHKTDGSVSIPSTVRKCRTRSAELQEATVAQKSTGLSTGIMGLDVRSTIRQPKQQNTPELQESSPFVAIKPAAARKRKAERDDLDDSVGRQSKTKKVATQKGSRILDQTMRTDSLATLEKETFREKDVPQVPQHDRVPGGDNAHEDESATAKTSHKRKRTCTVEEIEASKRRLQSLRKRPRADYSE